MDHKTCLYKDKIKSNLKVDIEPITMGYFVDGFLYFQLIFDEPEKVNVQGGAFVKIQINSLHPFKRLH